MQRWPDRVPAAITFDSFSQSMGDGRIRSSTDTGPGKTRRRSSAMPRALAGQIVMSWDQWKTLEYFIEHDLVGGTLPFKFPSQIGRGTEIAKFAQDLPTIRRFGGSRVEVDLQLELMP